MGLKLVTPPTVEPLTVGGGGVFDVKTHLRVSQAFTLDDAYLGQLVTAARKYVEDATDRGLISQTWAYYVDYIMPWIVKLPRGPVSAVSSVQYVDTTGALQTLATNRYQLSTSEETARLMPVYGNIWPVVRWQLDAVIVTYTVGYGTTQASVPEHITHAIKFLVGHWYMNREIVGDGTPGTIPHGFDQLLWLEHTGRGLTG